MIFAICLGLLPVNRGSFDKISEAAHSAPEHRD